MRRRTLPLIVVTALSIVAGAAAREHGRAALADEVEKRFEGRFILTTAGDGRYTIYQKLETKPAQEREIVCLLRDCYVEIGSVSEAALIGADQDRGVRGSVLRLFTRARDDQKRALAAPPSDRVSAESEWLDRAGAIASCVTDRRC